MIPADGRSSGVQVEVAPPAEFGRGYRAWLLFILLSVTFLNLADRQGLAAIAPAMKRDLGLTDTQLGLIQGLGFAIFYTLAGFPIARLAERRSRIRIIGTAVAVFSVFVLLCSQVRSFAQVLLCRIGVGSGDAGFNPPTASLLGDHYAPAQRASSMTVIWFGAPMGAFVGAVYGGRIAQYADWRTWFLCLAAPSLLIALLILFTLREPRRGAFDKVTPVGAPPSIRETLRFILGKRSMVHVLMGTGLAATAMNGIGQFWGRYYVAVFHIGMSQAGKYIGLISVAGMASGFTVGGFGVAFLARRDRRWSVWGPSICLALSTPLFLLGMTRGTVSDAFWIFLAAHVTLFVFLTPSLALAQNMVGANMRASCAFLINVVLGLVGVGFGPTLTGILSDTFAHRAFGAGNFAASCVGGAALSVNDPAILSACQSASSIGIREAMGTMTLLLVWSALHYLLASRRLRVDLDTHYAGQPTAAL